MAESVKTAVALGSFDGLHKGHKSVITCALSYKERGFVPTVLLFDNHPLLTISGKAPETILQPDVRNEMLVEMGMEADFVCFNDIKDCSPKEFFDEIIVKKLNAGAVCCGVNYRFGKNGSGNCDTLKELCDEAGIEISILPLLNIGSSPVSSTKIREAIISGNIPEANEMLGYEFCYKNEVQSGCRRGRLLGTPTINQYFDKGFIVPKHGVYASVTEVEGIEYPSVTNIGLRPTFENEDLRSETCILGFDGNLYGEIIKVSLLEYLRSEKRFNSQQELINQIASDAEKSKKLFNERNDCHV